PARRASPARGFRRRARHRQLRPRGRGAARLVATRVGRRTNGRQRASGSRLLITRMMQRSGRAWAASTWCDQTRTGARRFGWTAWTRARVRHIPPRFAAFSRRDACIAGRDTELIEAVRRVAADERYVDPDLGTQLVVADEVPALEPPRP